MSRNTFSILQIFTLLIGGIAAFSTLSSSWFAISSVDAQCTAQTEIQFKSPNAKDGVPSYIALPNGQGPIVYFENPTIPGARSFPPIIIQTVYSVGKALEFTKEGSLVVCTSDPPLRMGGSSVEINRGEALFDSLTILEALRTTPGLVYTLNFTLTDKNFGTVYTIQSPQLAIFDRTETPVSIRFRNSGFLTRAGISKEIPVNVSLPTWWIELVGRTGYSVAATQGSKKWNVTMKANFGTILPAGKTFDGADSIEFSGVTYVPPTDAVQLKSVTDNGAIFTFSCIIGGSYGTPTVATGGLTFQLEVTRNSFIEFDPLKSYIRYENDGGTAVLGIAMPSIIINLYTSQMGFDASNTGLVIQARSSQASLTGSEALVIRGIATFADLTFTQFAPRSATITFTTTLPSGATGQLFSGAIMVTDSAIKASRLRFADDSAISEQNAPYALPATPSATLGVFKLTMPTVRVLFVDSANRFDLTADKISLQLSLDPPTFIFDSTGTNTLAKTSDYGCAVWDNLAITATTSSNTTFSVRITDPTGIRTTLVSSKLTILDSTLSVASRLNDCYTDSGFCPLNLNFLGTYGSRTSAVYATDVSIFTTVGSTMPKIVLALEDWFGPVYNQNRNIDITKDSFTVKAYTADPNNEKILDTSGVYGRFQNGLYIFECLRISTATGLVRINFLAQTSNGLVFEGLGRPRTGFTTVLSSPLSGYAVRFASNSLLQYGVQTTSAIVGVALPPIVLEVVDSQNQVDSADASVTVVATTSTGETSAPVTASKGLISFPLVQFLDSAENPTITFTVASSNNPVGGQTLASGKIRLTTLVIPFYEIAFDNGRDTLSQITSPFQTKTDFTSWGEVRAILVLRDSAHETAQDLDIYVGNKSIDVVVSSDDASISSTSPTTVSFSPTCANRGYPCVDIRTVITGARTDLGVPSSGPVYLKYRVKSGPALLVGKVLVAGPLSIGTGSSCTGSGGSSALVAEFIASKTAFDLSIDTYSNQIAKALGVEPARVFINQNTSRQVVRTGFTDPLRDYTVTKVHISFLDPLATSTIRKSRADLQNEFLQVRPKCDLPELKLWAVYQLAQEKDCNPQSFIDGITAAVQCTRSGLKPQCDCYENGVVKDWGSVCANDQTLQPTLVTMCQEIRATCEASGIQALCSGVLVPKTSSMVWAWATLGAIGGVGIAGFLAYKRYQLKRGKGAKQKIGAKK